MDGGSSTPQTQDPQIALRTLVVGSLLVRVAEAQGDQEMDEAFGRIWLCGLVLVVIGAIWVAKTLCTSVRCCLRRLHVLPSRPNSLEGELEAEEKVFTTSLCLKRQRTRSSTTRGEEAEDDRSSRSSVTEEAESQSSSENEEEGAANRVCEVERAREEEETMRRRRSTSSGEEGKLRELKFTECFK